MMRIPKKYGEYRKDNCPFCEKQATAKNSQGLLVCSEHKDSKLPDIKCLCGSWIEIRIGKFGPYFFCMNCGNINLKKGLEMLEHNKKEQNPEKQKKEKVNFQKTKDNFILDSGKYHDFDYGVE
jgi:topoisomerase IA-like protein